MKRITYITCLLLACVTLSFHESKLLEPDTAIQKVKIKFLSPDNYSRELLLGFTPDNKATDDFDYGYDAKTADDFHNDLNWLIDGERYVIQGVGAFNDDKFYSLGLYLRDSGRIKISLQSLENFDPEIPVFLYDSFKDEYLNLNGQDYEAEVASGNFTERYYLAFSENAVTLNVNKIELENSIKIYKSNNHSILHITNENGTPINAVTAYNLEGKILFEGIEATNKFQVNTNNLQAQLLLIKIEVGNTSVVKKVLIP